MNQELIQKRGFSFRKFYLYDDKIVIEERTSSKITKYDIELDDIGYKFYYEKENTNIGKIVTWIIVCIPIILIIAYFSGAEIDKGMVIFNTVIWWGFAAFSFLKKNQDDIVLVGGRRTISFYRNKPNEKVVVDFITLLIQASKKYIKKKHLVFKEYETEEEIIGKLRWMLSMEVISAKEYDIIREEFKNRSLF